MTELSTLKNRLQTATDRIEKAVASIVSEKEQQSQNIIDVNAIKADLDATISDIENFIESTE